MSLTEEMIQIYLLNVPSLKTINNHDVKDSDGYKTGQMPLTISLGKKWIAEILDEETQQLTVEEKKALVNLQKALDGLPSLSIQSMISTVLSDLNEIQKNLLGAMDIYLESITQFEKHKDLLKALVLVLKILEYDLSKKPGPIMVGYGFFKWPILSNEQRIENHSQVKTLLMKTIEQFGTHYEQKEVLASATLN